MDEERRAKNLGARRAGMISAGGDGARFVALVEWEDGIPKHALRIEDGKELAGDTS